jgi:dienelactone hydrolase
VILAHGGGSSRGSYRNRYLAGRLRFAGWAALRVDLLTESERAADATGAFRFDIAHIARRLQRATEWAARQGLPGAHRLVLFGASTGAAAALVTAATRPDLVRAVAARGGRVDLAADVLDRVRAPVLMMVGGSDAPTLAANRAAARRLRAPSAVAVIRGAGHTFDEPGALGSVGERVTRWLDRLSPRSPGWLCALTSA